MSHKPNQMSNNNKISFSQAKPRAKSFCVKTQASSCYPSSTIKLPSAGRKLLLPELTSSRHLKASHEIHTHMKTPMNSPVGCLLVGPSLETLEARQSLNLVTLTDDNDDYESLLARSDYQTEKKIYQPACKPEELLESPAEMVASRLSCTQEAMVLLEIRRRRLSMPFSSQLEKMEREYELRLRAYITDFC